MSTVRLEVLPGISEVFGAQGVGHIVLDEETEDGATVGDVVRKLATEHKAFGNTVFDAAPEKLSGYVSIVLNDRLLESLDGLDTAVKDGDVIKLFPVIAGR